VVKRKATILQFSLYGRTVDLESLEVGITFVNLTKEGHSFRTYGPCINMSLHQF